MASLGYQAPILFLSEAEKGPPVRKAVAGSGHTTTAIIQPADFVTLAAGVLSRAATNTAASIYGMANDGEQQLFTPFGGNTTVGASSLFGFTQAQIGGPLIPEDSLDLTVFPALMNQLFQISLSSTTGWISGGTQQANIGTTGGLLLDPTTNVFVFDQTQTNKVMTVYAKVVGPNIVLPSNVVLGAGQSGDTGARVLVYFNSGVV